MFHRLMSKYTFWLLSDLEKGKPEIKILTAFCSGEHVLIRFLQN